MRTLRLRCKECGWHGTEDDALHAPSPFDNRDILPGCPRCYSACTMENLCDEPGCMELCCCGTPSKDGYRHTCAKHQPKE